MIVLKGADQGACIDGATMAAIEGLYAIAEDGTACPVQGLCIADGEGGAVSSTPYMALTIDGEVRQVLFVSLPLSLGFEYNITGTVVPVGSPVYLAHGTTDWDDLTSELVAEVLANPARVTHSDTSDGYFQLNDVSSTRGGVTLFAFPPPSLDIVAGANYITAEETLEGKIDDTPEEGVQTVLLDPSEIPRYGSDPAGQELNKSWDFVFDGTAPAGTIVYLSLGQFYRSEELLDLLVKSTTAASDGTWQIKVEKQPRTAHTAWIYADSAEGFTGVITEVKWHVCLSGDTLIMMADGSHKRLDALAVGDSVRAGDRAATVVTRLERGHYSESHRLYHFSDGSTVDETHMHRFFNVEQGFFQWLERWNIGEHALREDGAEVALERVDLIDERVEQFGIWTASHDYWANGLLSGETAANQHLIATVTAEQAAAMAASITEESGLELLGLEGLMP